MSNDQQQSLLRPTSAEWESPMAWAAQLFAALQHAHNAKYYNPAERAFAKLDAERRR